VRVPPSRGVPICPLPAVFVQRAARDADRRVSAAVIRVRNGASLMTMKKRFLSAAVSAALAVAGWGNAADAQQAVKLEKGDHVSLIGNTLADRMQHYGWLETLTYSRLPDQELVFRNLGFSGDEVAFRDRSKDFGTPDEWLWWTHTDVIFAFFGFNESFQGAKGLDKFKADYDKWVKATLSKQYGTKGKPRLVLFAPIAVENLKDPNFPDGVELNKNIKLYADAIAEVAKANDVPFVDLFTISQELYKQAGKPMTINGIHLNEYGDQQLAQAIDKALFAAPAPARDTGSLEKLRQAVNDKNFHWFERYRTLDGYNVFGDRSKIKYKQELLPGKPAVSNWDVMQRELQVLDVMTANRDKRVQAVAQGKDLVVDDSNTPPFIPVGTNLPGKNPDGTHVYLDGQEAIARMKVARNMKVNLFADEKQFPDLIAPVQMAWDTKGRLWVACWNSYPRWRPKDEMKDKIIVLEDTDGDGKADKCSTFIDKLNCPTGFEFYNGGIILAQAPGILFVKDTDGDGKADQVTRLLEGFDSADTHHTSNSFTFDPGGALYWQEGTFMHSSIETLEGPIHAQNGAVWRFEPKSFKFDHYTSYGFANPHGHVFDAWGNDIVIDGTAPVPHYGPAFSGKLYGLDKRKGNNPTVYKQRTRPCPGAEILSSKAFPDDMQGNFLVPNVIGIQGILNYKLTESGAGLVGTEVTLDDGKTFEPIVTSDDRNFRPSDVEIGPDGAIYFTDWHNAIIGHLQHHLRDPNRDHAHGRVYRVTYEGRELSKAPPIAGQSVAQLLDLLKSPENRVRYRAKIELSAHDTKEVIPAVEKWIAALDKNDANYAHQLTEGLWMYSWNNVVNEPLLRQVLASPDHHARTAAVRVLCYWMDRVPAALDLLKVAAVDKHPRVRLEAIRACSFSKDPKALDTAMESLAEPDDKYIKYTLDETVRTLEGLNKPPKPKGAKK
jgi:glucose/arabinose dehydrogenase